MHNKSSQSTPAYCLFFRGKKAAGLPRQLLLALTRTTQPSHSQKSFRRYQVNSLSNNEPAISDVATELRRYDAACADLLLLLRRQDRTPEEDRLCIKSYIDLKEQLKSDLKRGTIGGVKGNKSYAEELFDYAIRHALQALKPPINRSRVLPTWPLAVFNAKYEIQYKLHDLENSNPNA